MADEQKTAEVTEDSLKNQESEVVTEDKKVDSETQLESFNKSQVDKIIERRLVQERRSNAKQLEGLGDLDEAKKIVQDYKNLELESKKKKGQFEDILKEKMDEKDSQIQKLSTRLSKLQIEDSILGNATELGAIKPQQVKELLANSVKLADDGTIEVLDNNKNTRYDSKGEPLSVRGFVEEFLNANPHFQRSTPSGAGSKGNVAVDSPQTLKLGDLDFSKKGDREKYATYRKERDSKPTVINLTK